MGAFTESPTKQRSSAFQSPTFDRDVSIHVNEAVGAASVSPSGRDIVLASRNGLYIIDLDSPWSPPRHLPHRSPWEVADVQWSPFAGRDHWIISTSNQKALVWNLELTGARTPIEHVLHAHQRAITDINFSAHHPDVLATCGVDSYVHCWDLRQSSRPVMSFADWFAGATQVKWNRQDPHIVASAHDKVLRIWDDRKGAFPLRSIDAHRTKINGVDWNRTKAMGVLTCSLDKTIKFWDCNNPEDEPEMVISTPFPVSRARHTPFGQGVLAMPQRGDCNLHLYDRRKHDPADARVTTKPVHAFDGHTDHVKEFLWRARGGVEGGIDKREFQLVSWGTDKHLRLHHIDPTVLKKVSYEKGRELDKGLHLTRLGAVYRTFREESTPESTPSDGQLQGLSAMFRAASISGMSKGPVHGHHSRTTSDYVGASTGMQTKSGAMKQVNPIKWMEGVKIGKRGCASTPGEGPRSAVMSPDQPFRWDTPESLGDEITFVGGKFRKVTFEHVDVSRRTATVTLNGPWGPDNKPAFVRVQLAFPKDYPTESAPECNLLKTTSSMSDETLAKLQSEIRSIAEHYRQRKRGCFEAVVGYLLGERGLEESISWFDEEKLDSQFDGGNEDSSSDEEDGIDADFNDDQPQDMEMSGTDMIGAANANANVPLPKGCGAVWHTDGRLVCFFPPKPEPRPIFNFNSLKAHERLSRSQKLSEGLRRLYHNSPDPRLKTASSRREDDNDQASSDGSWMSTSSSSDSEEMLGPIAGPFPPPAAWRGASTKFQRSSQVSSAGYQSRAPPPKSKSIITIHSTQDLLPTKKVLAEGYEIFGDGAYVCANNAAVARRHGCEEVADVWEMVKFILSKEVPLELMPQSFGKDEPVLVTARRAIVRIKKKDSGLDLAFDEAEAAAKPKLKGRVKWGDHPFARGWLIRSLFDHYERIADVQMLAMLSCVLSEPAAEATVTDDLVHLRLPESSMSTKFPAFSLNYFPSQQVAASLLQPAISAPPTPIGDSLRLLDKVEGRLGNFGSYTSSNDAWGSDPAFSDPVTPYSTGNTPPILSRNNTRSSLNASYSESPEQHQQVRRSQSNLATAFASLSRGFSTTASSSPPSGKPNEGAELSTSAPGTTVTWGTNTFYGSASPAGLTPRSRYNRRNSSVTREDYEMSDEEDDSPRKQFSKNPSRANEGEIVVNLTLKNQDQFDDEGCVTVPLLDTAMEWKYQAYRDTYANFLHAWGLAISRSEILKFNGLPSHWDEVVDEETAPDDIGVQIGRRGLPKPATTHPTRRLSKAAKREPRKMFEVCAVCCEPVYGAFAGCAECQNVIHADCAVADALGLGEGLGNGRYGNACGHIGLKLS